MAETRKLILSFDDGPAPVTALDSILATLKAARITAEFYVLGEEVRKYPSATRRIIGGGHKVQNHSWSHPDLSKLSEARVLNELQTTQNLIGGVTGITPSKLRPPYGAGGWAPRYDPELLRVASKLGLKINNWDIDTEDWKAPRGIGQAKQVQVTNQFKTLPAKKDIVNVLMHVQAETARDLPAFIQFLRQAGFEFATPV